MGEKRAWLAVQGISREQVLQRLAVEPTGTTEQDGEWDIDGAALPDGWTLIRFDRREQTRWLTDTVLRAMSSDCRVITCSINETTMVSTASEWVRGGLLWAIEHDGGQEGGYDLQVEGTLPVVFESLRERLFAEQVRADALTELELRKPPSERDYGASMAVDLVFDLPVELFGKLTGYRHNDMNTPCTLVFEELVLK